MKSVFSLKSVVTFLCAGAIVFAAGRQAGGAEISKEEIIQKAWKAMFGELKNEDVKSLSVEAFIHGSTVPNHMVVKRPNLFRNEVSSGVLAFDGKKAAWIKREPDKNGNPRKPELIEPSSWKHFEIDIALLFPAFFEYPSEFKDLEAVEGIEAYVLQVDLPLGGIVTYFLDAGSFHVIKRTVNWSGGKEDITENRIDGYADYDGILFPDGYRFQGRDGMEKAFYRNYKVNVNPGDELFVLPAELVE